jgi:DNA-binding NarL/FixJ family response regulator
VRIVLCDEDGLMREAVESLIPKAGHELVGVADTTADGVALVEVARPDAVVFDMTIGYNTDFDVIEAAQGVGATVVVFAYNTDDSILSGYARRPIVVHKPDLVLLEATLRRLEAEGERAVERERRQREMRDLPVPPSTGLADAAAFYEAINAAVPGDAMISIETPEEASVVAERVVDVLRGADRLLATSHTVRVFLVSGGDVGRASFLRRLAEADIVPPGSKVTSVIVAEGESPLDAFDRLKAGGEVHDLTT